MGLDKVVIHGLPLRQRPVSLLQPANGLVAVPDGPIEALNDVVVSSVICDVDIADVSIPTSSASFGNAELLLPRLDVAGETISDNLLRLLLRQATGRGKSSSPSIV